MGCTTGHQLASVIVILVWLTATGAYGASNECTGVVEIDAGGYHTCAVVEDKTVRCWGYNEYGQLGDGTIAVRLLPVMVSGLSAVSSISAGYLHTCAVLQDGTARCWGKNDYGQLGNGGATSSNVPVEVSGLSAVSSIRAGVYHTCAVLQNGSACCWGNNEYGQLGDGSTTASRVPVTVSGLNNVRDIAVGYRHTCAVLLNNTALCWGYNLVGQLGSGVNSDSNVPVAVLNNVRTITAGFKHTCADLQDDTAYCWGSNDDGQVGQLYAGSFRVPNVVSGLSTVSSITTGLYHTCAMLTDNTARCWGYNGYGQLGSRDNAGRNFNVPVAVSGLNNARSITAGAFYTCAALKDGSARCWGDNSHHQLGDGTTFLREVPVSLTCPCTGQPSTTTPVMPPQSTWYCTDYSPGSNCTAQCNPGYSPQAVTSWVSTCYVGAWNTPAPGKPDSQLVCNPNSCADQPSTTTPAMPQHAFWSCPGITHGSKCTAKCDPGYTAQQSTSWVSTCAAGSWSTPAKEGNDGALVCNPSPCAAANPTAENSSVLLPEHATWNCPIQPAAHGAVCMATCSDGYHPHAQTSWKSTCSLGHWGAPVAGGEDSQLVCDPDSCTGQPSITSPAMPLNAAWSCTGTTHGSTCTAQCNTGYTPQTSTSWVSTCAAGAWSTPAKDGSDTKLLCNPNSCTGQPCITSPAMPLNAAWKCAGSDDGSNCTAECNTGYTAKVSTSWVSTCHAGSWSEPGADGQDKALICSPNSCTGTPNTANLPPVSAWSCPSLTDGSKCKAVCNSGYTARAATSWVALCSLGSWSAPGVDTGDSKLTCEPNPCSGTPSSADLPANAAFQCSSVTSGSKCRATCSDTFTAAASTSWVSTCFAGRWSTAAPDSGTSNLKCLASCKGNPSPDPNLGVFSCTPSTLSGDVCNATCLYGTLEGVAPPSATCNNGAWTITSGTCAPAPVVPPAVTFVTSSIAWTWYLTGSCNADMADALVHAMLVDLQALLVTIDSKGVLSIGEASCTPDVPLSKLQLEITLTEAVTAKRKRAAAHSIVRPAGTGTLDKLRALIMGTGLAQAMPTVMKGLQQAGVECSESETKASLTAAGVKDGTSAEGSVCAAGQQAYTPTGPCYVCPPWQYNPVAGGTCTNCTVPNTEPNLSRTGCSCLPGYKEAYTAAGLLEKCVLGSLVCLPGTDFDAHGTSCVSTEVPVTDAVTNDSFNVTAGRWTDLDVLKNDRIAQAGGGRTEIAVQPKAGRAVIAGTLIRYLANAGALGVDSFNYTYVAKNGMRHTAVVTLHVTAGSCNYNMCGLNKSSGECDAATGRCNCLAGSRLEAKFVLNPSVSARNVTPQVPACRYQFIPTGMFKLSGMTAKIGQLVNVTFRLAQPRAVRAAAAACITLDVAAPLAGVGNYPNCPTASAQIGSLVETSSMVVPQLINLVRPTCVDGEYSVAIKVPNSFRNKSCFNIGVQLADGTTKRAIVMITAVKGASKP